MDQVNILATSLDADDWSDFEHNDSLFVFDTIGPNGPRKLVDGEIWIFVEWIMAEMSGLELCRRLRADARTHSAHITMILDRDSIDDRKRALSAGADDYILGPVNRSAILDRVLALQSGRLDRFTGQKLKIGKLQIDFSAEQARWGDGIIPLRPNEFRLLRFMAENPNTVLSRSELVEGLGKDGEADHPRTVDVWMKRLRQGLKKVGAQGHLRTVHKKGYVLDIRES